MMRRLFVCPDIAAILLTVADQNAITRLADLGTMLLQTGEDHEVRLIHHGAAITRNVLRASLLLLGRAAAGLPLCHDRSRRGRKQCGNEKCSDHFRPLSDGGAIRTIEAMEMNTKRNRQAPSSLAGFTRVVQIKCGSNRSAVFDDFPSGCPQG
jgi:hypothetical protein